MKNKFRRTLDKIVFGASIIAATIFSQEVKGQDFMAPKGNIDVSYSLDNTTNAKAYNSLTTRAQRDSIIALRLKEDWTDMMRAKGPPLYPYIWNCNEWTMQLLVNSHDWGEKVYASNKPLFNWYKGDNIDSIYINNGTIKDMGKLGLPMYSVSENDPITMSQGHSMNAILTGDSITKFEDWNFIEPQGDLINVKPGHAVLPANCKKVQIYYDYLFKNKKQEKNYWSWKILEFELVNGVAKLTYNVNNDNSLTYNIDNLDVDPRLFIPINERVHFQETRINTPARIIPTLEDKLKVYPTLVRDYINIEANVNHPVRIDVELYDMAGRLVENHHENAYFDFKERINLSKLKQGVYVLRIKSQYQNLGYRIVKQ
jgi:hypothetical protein